MIKELIAKIATVCWLIWKERCHLVFQRVNPNPESVLGKFNTTWHEFCLLTKVAYILQRENMNAGGSSKQRRTREPLSADTIRSIVIEPFRIHILMQQLALFSREQVRIGWWSGLLVKASSLEVDEDLPVLEDLRLAKDSNWRKWSDAKAVSKI